MLFQPSLNAFSVFDDVGLTPPRNASLSQFVFQLIDRTVGSALPNVVYNSAVSPARGSHVYMWLLWQNQWPTTANIQIDLNDQMSGYTNQIVNLTVDDADKRAGVPQVMSAYIARMPYGISCNLSAIYQYDDTNPPTYRGAPITVDSTPVTDGWPSFRVVFVIGGTGRPYCQFDYSADDGLNDNLQNGVVSINILVQETPATQPFNVTVNQNGQVMFTLPAISSAATMALNRGVVTALPLRGSLFQVGLDGLPGARVQILPTEVVDPARRLYFKPDPYTTSNPSGSWYSEFSFYIDNGLAQSNSSIVQFYVNSIHLPPHADPVPVTSTSGNDVPVHFLLSTMQTTGVTGLTAVIASYPLRGTLKQNDGPGTVITNVTCAVYCNVTDIVTPQVIYVPQQLADPSVANRYTETFTYRAFDGVLYSDPATVTVQVGSRVRPPIVYNQVFTTKQTDTLLIALNGTVQDAGDTWTAVLASLPSEGKLYQMTNAQKGAEITAPTSVSDPNFYLFFEPSRFSSSPITFTFFGQQNPIGLQSALTATVTIYVTPVGYAPTVASTTVRTVASPPPPDEIPLIIPVPFFAGPTPPPTDVYITDAPQAGSLYQYDTASGVRGPLITASDVSNAKNHSLPGFRVTDPGFQVLYVPTPYLNGMALLDFAFATMKYIARSNTTDGLLLSPSPATITISVTQVDFPPVALDAWLTTPQETPIIIALSNYVLNPSANEGATFECRISATPLRGTLFQVDANGKATMIPTPGILVTDPASRVIYRPRDSFGSPYDSFKFFAVDPRHNEMVRFATVTLNVTFVNKPPLAPALDARMYENQGKVVTLPCRDPEGLNCSFYLTDANLPKGQLFQFVESGGSVPLSVSSLKNVSTGGEIDVDPEAGLGNSLGNYTGDYGGGFDVSPYLGAPITTFPVRVTDPLGRVVFTPLPYTHGNTAYDYIYGNPFLPGQGTFSYVANDGTDNSTTPGVVSVRVKTVVYAPLAYDRTITVAEDGFVVIQLPIYNFDPDETPLCFIMTVPSKGALFQYDGRSPLFPKAEQILSLQTHVQDFNPDGTPGTGRTVVYEPPKLKHGASFTNFTFRTENSKQSRIATITIDVTKTNHAPTAPSFSVVLSGHNSTAIVNFNVTEVDIGQNVHLNISNFPSYGTLYASGHEELDPSPSGFNRWVPDTSTRLTPGSNQFYPYYNDSQGTLNFAVLFDDMNMGGQAVTAGCVVPGTDVACGYTSFGFRVIDELGLWTEGFVQVLIQCGPNYVVNTWERIGHVCVTCPIGAKCATEGQFKPMAIPGYYRGETPTGLLFVQCDPRSACLGTLNASAPTSDTNSQCALGYYGRMCAACQDHYYKLNNECRSCPTTSIFWVILVGVPAVVLLMFATLHVSRRGIDLTFFAIVLTYCQILAVYAQYHLTWPDSVMTALTVFSITHLNLDIFAVSCYYNTGDYQDKWKAKMAVVPGLALGVLAMVLLLMTLRSMCPRFINAIDFTAPKKKHSEDIRKSNAASAEAVAAAAAAAAAAAKANQRPGFNRMASSGIANHQKGQLERFEKDDYLAALDSRAFLNNDPSAGFDESTPTAVWLRYYVSLGVRTFTLLVFVAYLPICVKAFQLFNCTSFPDGTHTFDADPSLTCEESWWHDLMPWGVVAVIVYGAGIPLWFCYALWKTHPPFEMVCWWGPVWYPRVITGADALKKKKISKADQAATAAATEGRSTDINAADEDDGEAPLKSTKTFQGKLPPPPSKPPAIPAPGTPEKDEHVPHLHAATVHALEQARAGLNEDEVSARKAALEDDAEIARQKQQAAWAQSENLALTSAENTTLSQQQKITRFMFTLVIDPFRDDLFFWMLIVLFRSFLLAMVSIFFADEPVYQATLALLVLFLYTLGTAYFQPYVNPSMNKLEFLTVRGGNTHTTQRRGASVEHRSIALSCIATVCRCSHALSLLCVVTL